MKTKIALLVACALLGWIENVRAVERGIYITSNRHNGVNSDGLDIDGCSHVMVSDCRIDTGDDALCLKTTRTNGQAQPCRYITVTNCILTSSSAALKIGTESHADFEHITVTNCVVDGANRGLNIIVRDGGSGQHLRGIPVRRMPHENRQMIIFKSYCI